MDKRSKVLVIIVLALILIISLWLSGDSSKPVNCSKITSMRGIDKCLENTIVATGTLKCVDTNGMKGTGISLNFDDATSIVFLEDYGRLMRNCTDYNAKRVEVTATYHQCKMTDQCAGVGLSDIKSLKVMDYLIPDNSECYLTCVSDSDCTTTYYPFNDCCMRCDIFPINAEGLKLQEKWRSDNCDYNKTPCPEYKCLWPHKNVSCMQGICQLRG